LAYELVFLDTLSCHKDYFIYCGSVNVICLSDNPFQHQRVKHIEMYIYFVRGKVARGQVQVLFVPPRCQIIVILMKGLKLQLFDDFRDSLNIRPPPISTKGVY